MWGKFLFLFFIFIGSGSEWELKKDAENIRVYTRRISTSDFKELQCKTTVRATLGSVVKLLLDVDAYPQWIYNCVHVKKIKKVGNTISYSYQLFDVPFPVSDRDVVAVGYTTQDAKTKIVTVKSEVVNGMLPEVDGVVRIKKFSSIYILIPKPNGEVEVNFELGTEPGGIVPAWLVNLFIVQGPFDTHKKMNELLQTSAYKNSRLEFIEEL